MIHPDANATLSVRSGFVIDPAKKVRLTITYPASPGRSCDEILRVIDSLQLTDGYSVATPVNWRQGEDVTIVPSPQDPDELRQKFPKGFGVLKPYLRYTPSPIGGSRLLLFVFPVRRSSPWTPVRDARRAPGSLLFRVAPQRD